MSTPMDINVIIETHGNSRRCEINQYQKLLE